MGILFTGRENDPSTLENVLGEAIGASSVCWDNMKGTGLFDERRARDILAEVTGWIGEHYVPREAFDLLQAGREVEQTMLRNALPRLVTLDRIMAAIEEPI